ncbi:MAG: dihydroorotase [Alphaproteobacteria bacterium]
MTTTPQRIEIRRPDDWHLHLRDGAMLEAVLPWTVRQFARAIVMPNLVPPIDTVAAAAAYRDRILAALPAGAAFTPLMTCYLGDATRAEEVERGFAEGVFTAVKLYPAHATTNSAHGVSDIAAIRPVLERMQRIDMPLLVHGEVTDPEVDIFDREAVFIERVAIPLRRDFPDLRIVFEHVTTADAAAFVTEGGPRLAATVTPQHLMVNRNAMLVGGIRPHLYCLPILKRERDRRALRKAVASGHPRFFLGTDSAPHHVDLKECACGCAGVFNAPTALESYLQVFEEEGALQHFEAFASENGARFYGLPPNEGTIVLERRDWTGPAGAEADGIAVTAFRAGETLPWRVA